MVCEYVRVCAYVRVCVYACASVCWEGNKSQEKVCVSVSESVSLPALSGDFVILSYIGQHNYDP